MGVAGTTKNVAIIGAGVAGVTAAASLRKRGHSGRIWLFDRGAFAYDRPPLSKEFLTGKVGAEEIALYSPEWFTEHDIIFRAGTDVSTIDRENLAVISADGARFEVDVIVLALGGLARQPGWAGASSARVHTIRTIEDAQELRAHLNSGCRLLVVGAGLLGSEIALSALSLGGQVATVDLDQTPLTGVVGERLATWLLDQNAAAGIEHLNTGIELVTEVGHEVNVRFSSGEERRFDRIVVATGLVPDTSLAQASGLRVDGGIEVDESQRSSDSRIFAIGDCAVRAKRLEARRQPGHWEAAKLDGERVAASIMGEELPAETAAWFWSDRGALHLDVIGELGSADAHVERGEFGGESFSLGGFLEGRFVAAVCVNDPLGARHLRKILDRNHAVSAAEFADLGFSLKQRAAGR